MCLFVRVMSYIYKTIPRNIPYTFHSAIIKLGCPIAYCVQILQCLTNALEHDPVPPVLRSLHWFPSSQSAFILCFSVFSVNFTGLVLLTLFLQDMLSLALPCILITFLKAVSFSKFPMHC